VDAVDVLILALRLLLVALLYLFLFAVLRMAMAATRPAPVHRLSLRVVDAGASNLSPGEVLQVDAGTTLGRDARADVVVADSAVSSTHARVDQVGRGWVVVDLGSTNGTRVNEAVVRGRTRLVAGDVLSLGTVRLEVITP
jgi:predicted component of type VI protein secretion system